MIDFRFTLYGSDCAEIREKAEAQMAKFLGVDAVHPDDYHLEARPVIGGSGEVVNWRAEVKARL